jgi:dihydroxy-acid dehydratase
VLVPRSLRNVPVVRQVGGGSSNGLIHLTALAGRPGLGSDPEGLDAIGRELPTLIDLKFSGEHLIQHFHDAGGVSALLRVLLPRLDSTACRPRTGAL